MRPEGPISIQRSTSPALVRDRQGGPKSSWAAPLTRLAHVIMLAWGWQRATIAFTAGALSVLALAPFNIWPVMFVTFPVLVWLAVLLHRHRQRIADAYEGAAPPPATG